MADVPADISTGIKPEPIDQKLSRDERAACRARVAKLLGQLIYKQWQRERGHDTEQNPKSH